MTLPIWLTAITPASWTITLPISYVIDTLALLVALRIANRHQGDYSDLPAWSGFFKRFTDQFDRYKSAIWRTWLYGLLCWLLSTLLMLAPSMLSISAGDDNQWLLSVSDALLANPFSNIFALAWAAICVLAGVALIYATNRHLSLRKTEMTVAERSKTALYIALFTAPYIFLIPYHVFA